MRRGLSRTQAASATRDTRIPLPAEVVASVLLDSLERVQRAAAGDCLAPRPWAELLRRRYAFVLSFVFMGRQDTSTMLASVDHGIDDKFIWLRLTEKMRRHRVERRVVRLDRRSPPSHGFPSLLPQLAELGLAYLSAKAALGGAATDWLFQLPRESKPVTTSMSGWVATTLDELGVRAPVGFAYLGHSLRSGGSSAAEAVKVPRARGDWLGGWAAGSNTREVHYIDPTVGPTPAAYRLFGWLLNSHYEASLPTSVPDPRRAAAALL